MVEIHQYVQDISVLQAHLADAKSANERSEAEQAIETAQRYLNFMLERNRKWAEKQK